MISTRPSWPATCLSLYPRQGDTPSRPAAWPHRDRSGGLDPRRHRHFCREVGLRLFDALAEPEANKFGDRDRAAYIGFRRLQRLLHRVLGVDYERLGEEDNFLVVFAHPALDHLL